MLIKQYAAFVARTDQFQKLSREKRREIAIFGLASEIGSLVSAVKKEQLQEGGALSSNVARAEVKEELGDVIWYSFVLAQIEDDGAAADILETDIANLKTELERDDKRTNRIHEVLSEQNLTAFLAGAEAFSSIPNREFYHYQDLAFLTARTKKDTLHTVCMSVLVQLGAQLMRLLLPQIERELNTQLVDRDVFTILGEIAWHLSAIAALYKIKLDDVAEFNVKKAQFRRPDGRPTPLHDAPYPEKERFPRRFEVVFESPTSRTSRMYCDGKQLGDELTDNAHEPDGYRFHDVMHLANAAHLGWSPVLRKLMNKKRRSKPEIDEVQDGARAAILEELIIKFIHCEGAKRAELAEPHVPPINRRLFPDDVDIPFRLLKQVHSLSQGHEPYDNKYWEWENAIRDGYRLFYELRQAGAGKVIVDLNQRSVEFISKG